MILFAPSQILLNLFAFVGYIYLFGKQTGDVTSVCAALFPSHFLIEKEKKVGLYIAMSFNIWRNWYMVFSTEKPVRIPCVRLNYLGEELIIDTKCDGIADVRSCFHLHIPSVHSAWEAVALLWCWARADAAVQAESLDTCDNQLEQRTQMILRRGKVGGEEWARWMLKICVRDVS